MKLNKFLAGLAMVAGALGMSSCSEDFDVAAPYKDITVVYGLLNIDDNTHYIRIQKAFMDQNRSALDLAKIADSSYYRNIEVHMKELSNGRVLRDDIISRVNLADENLPKEAGTFFESPSYAYKYSRTLNRDYTYRLVITNKETGNVDSAESNVINTSPLNSEPGSFYVVFFVGNDALSFAPQLGPNKFNVNVSAPTNAKYVEGYIRFRYTSSTDGGPQVDSSFLWNFATQVVADPDRRQVSLEVSRNAFFSVIRDHIKPAPTNVRRFIDSSDVIIWVANEPYYNYLRASAAQSGINADQIRTNYTNVQGKDVIGVFASRAQRTRLNIPIDLRTLDSLKVNALTKDLNIAGYADH